ncbi:hypothetical protein ES692_07545 [Psychroserpens burtonensis]|uniref:Lipoprotein n=1 Tax=Psychroserpens burtonensis TaxID=49278 RepID=A0A5C7B9F6_9FLAO|nr:hypothetical protein [Psychroserpens burtonensis]TXE18091.1 hypothetical protein ES692_07545 [Psychroserpens burtonensis]
MKLTAYLFFSLIFLTSCNSYKKIDLSVGDINCQKTYKITTIDGKKFKDKKCEQTLTSLNCSKNIIPLNKIVEIKERRFSYLETSGILILTGITVAVIVAISNIGIDVNTSF